MTVVAPDVDATFWDDLQPPCEATDHNGDHPAGWISVRPCCDVLKCDPCASRERARYSLVKRWACGYCQTPLGKGRLGNLIHLQLL